MDSIFNRASKAIVKGFCYLGDQLSMAVQGGKEAREMALKAKQDADKAERDRESRDARGFRR